jgi:NADH:ubiquinone oxidoreductase subunit 3 (subunit A)
MEIFSNLFFITTAALVLTIIFKTYLFIKRTPSHKYTNWFLFDKYRIYNSSSERTAKAKKTQNVLSLIILIFIIIDAAFLFLSHIQ